MTNESQDNEKTLKHDYRMLCGLYDQVVDSKLSLEQEKALLAQINKQRAHVQQQLNQFVKLGQLS